jgi:hypothetical protein
VAALNHVLTVVKPPAPATQNFAGEEQHGRFEAVLIKF